MVSELATIDEAKREMALVTSVDEAASLTQKYAAMREGVKRAGFNLDRQNEFAEAHIRAARLTGEMLGEATPGKGGDRKSSNAVLLDLDKLGITKMQSHRWQTLARWPGEMFEQHVASTKDSSKELTFKGAYTAARQHQSQADPTPDDQPVHEDVYGTFDEIAATGVKFGAIYADPPWKYGNQGTRAATNNHYQTQTVDDICAYPVADVVAKDAHLHLWTTNAFLFDARRVIEAWGFEYKSCLVWVKPQMGIGNYWRVSHEFMLLGVRGRCPFRSRSQMSWIQENRTKHSAKPERVADIIEQVSPGPYLEMFGRRTRKSWSVFGNQIERSLMDGNAGSV